MPLSYSFLSLSKLHRNKECYALREEILADPPNSTQFGGIYFGGRPNNRRRRGESSSYGNMRQKHETERNKTVDT